MGPFLGEQTHGRVAAGLGMAAEPGMAFYKEMIEIYEGMDFTLSADSAKQVTVVQHTTDLLKKYGYIADQEGIQTVAGINIFPPEYFNPQDFQTGVITLTENTYTIHHFAESWKPPIEKRLHDLSINFSRKFGRVGRKIAYAIGLPYWIFKKLKNNGIKETIGVAMRKLTRK